MPTTYNGTPDDLLTYTSPSLKLTRQSDGVYKYQAHNLYLNSAAPANQSITVVSGATYAVTITGTVSTTASGAATGTWTAGTQTFTAATTTLTFGSTSGAGTVHVRRTPSVDTYIATTGAAKYALPYEWDGSGNPLGILVEEARTNLLTYSRMKTGAVAGTSGTAPTGWGLWTGGTTTVETTGGLFGDGYTRLSATGARQFYSQSVSVSANTTYRVSLWANVRTASVMSNALTAAGLPAGASQSDWTANGTAVTAGDTTPTGIVLLQYTLTISSTGGTADLRFGAGCSASTTSDIDLYLAQIEAGSFATSPIETYGATATRAVDNISLATSAFPWSWPLTVYAHGTGRENSAFVESDNVAIAQYMASTKHRTFSGGTSSGNSTSSADILSTPEKVAGRFATDNVRLCVSGTLATADTSASQPANLGTSIRIGHELGGNVTLNRHIRQIMIVPRAMSDAELQTLTGS